MKLLTLLMFLGTLIFISIQCGDKPDIKEKVIINEKLTKNFSETFEGSIKDKYLIVVKLFAKDGIISGSYYYKSQRKEISLSGAIDSMDNLILNEYNESGNQTGLFKGKLVENQISGIWSKPNGTNPMNFVLNKIADIAPNTLENKIGLSNASNQVSSNFSDPKNSDINSFWSTFQKAVKDNDKLLVAEMTNFPFYNSDLKSYKNKEEFVSDYDYTFSSNERFMILNAKVGEEITAPKRKSEPNIDYYDGATIKFVEVIEKSILSRYREELKLSPDARIFVLEYFFDRDMKTSSHPYQSVSVTFYFASIKEGYKLFGTGMIL